jgi:hypothetical protein
MAKVVLDITAAQFKGLHDLLQSDRVTLRANEVQLVAGIQHAIIQAKELGHIHIEQWIKETRVSMSDELRAGLSKQLRARRRKNK